MTVFRVLVLQKCPFTRRNFLALEEISGHRKKLLVTGRNFMLQLDISCHRKKYLVTGRNFLSQDEISCQRQKCPVTGRNFLSQKETSCHGNEFHAKVKNFLPQEEIPKLPLFWTSFVASDSCCFGTNLTSSSVFWATFFAESIGSYEVKYFIPPW